MLAHLGFPQYFMNILGPWQLACAAALIAPGVPLIKEWAYAGAFFNYSSAIVSHMSVGDGPDQWAAAAVFAVFSVCSWTLRPPDRRFAGSRSIREIGISSWIVPLVVLILMIVVALFTLPAPPQF
jgi:DoxX-like family